MNRRNYLRTSLVFFASACAAPASQVPSVDADAAVANFEAAPKALARCSQTKLATIFAPATDTQRTVELDCRLFFGDYQNGTAGANKQITKELIVRTSNVVVDCQGGRLAGSNGRAITIRSRRLQATPSGGTWQRTDNTIVRNCAIEGRSEIVGMGEATGSDGYLSSRFDAQHTARAQAAAPRNTRFVNNRHTNFKTAIYANVGTVGLTVRGSHFSADTVNVAIYLNAESTGNLIENNVFDVRNLAREVIAVDGSAHNTIRNNDFTNAEVMSAIRLYRNCGERGMIRHQTPSDNLIDGNRIIRYNPLFVSSAFRSIILGSRQGSASYCHEDDGFPWGSSADDGDYARNNTVSNNRFHYTTLNTNGQNLDHTGNVIKVNYSPNTVTGNVTASW